MVNIWAGLGLSDKRPKSQPSLRERYGLSNNYVLLLIMEVPHIQVYSNKLSYKLGHLIEAFFFFPFLFAHSTDLRLNIF